MKQQQRQTTTQNLTTSPRTIISARILQCSTEELYDYIGQQVQENPVIDMEASQPIPQTSEFTKKLDWLRKQNVPSRERREDNSEKEYVNDIWDLNVPEESSLSQQLVFQLISSKLDGSRMDIARYIANSLNEDGFFVERPEDVAERLGVDLSEIFEVLDFM